MNTLSINKIKRMLGLGFVMFALRIYQNAYDFDPSSGLHFRSVVGIALVALIIGSLVLVFLKTRSESTERPHFSDHFAVPERSTIIFVSASLLFAAGGVLLGVHALSHSAGIAPLVTVFFALASFLGFLLLVKLMRVRGANSVAPVLPSLFFGAFWVLTLYLPAANDPILARYYLQILAAAVSAYAFAQLAGFFRCETRVRNFNCIAEYAVMLDIAAIADLNQHSALFAACAVMLSGFLMLQEKKPEAVIDTNS